MKNSLGDFQESRGWTKVIINAGVARAEVVQSLFSGDDVVRTKYANQVTDCCHDILVNEAYDQYIVLEFKDKKHKL